MPSRCIFFFSALRAWSTLLSRTSTCTLAPSLMPGRIRGSKGRKSPENRLSSRAALAEMDLRVHNCTNVPGRSGFHEGTSMVASRALLAGALARRRLLRIAGLAAVAALTPRRAPAQVFTGTSISQAAQDARRDVGRLGLRADAMLRHVIADGRAQDARAVRRFRTEQVTLARELSAVLNSRVSEDDWLLIVPTRELDLVLAMRPLVIRIAPKPEMVEAVLNRRLPQLEPLAGDSAEDVLLALVLERRVALFEQLRNDDALQAALKDAVAALKGKLYGLAAFELERLMREMTQAATVAAVAENLGPPAAQRLYNALVVRFVPFIGWTYFTALLLASVYYNRDTTAPVLR